jgi:hypothetical protein
MVNTCYSYCTSTADCFGLIPSEVCIEIVDGTQKVFEVEIMDNEGDPIDITNDTITFTVKDEFGGTTKLQKINTVGGHSDPTNGKTIFTIAQTDIPPVSPYEVRNWVYEIRRTDAGSVEDVHLQGDFIVNPVVGV